MNELLQQIEGYRGGRNIAIWGTGDDSRTFLEENLQIKPLVKCIIDNDISKESFIFMDLPVMHPSSIDNWKGIFVIITLSRYEYDIVKQLYEMGLKRNIDYVSWNRDTNKIQEEVLVFEESIKLIKTIFPTGEVINIYSNNEFQKNSVIFNQFDRVRKSIDLALAGKGGYPGFCISCGKDVRFKTYNECMKNKGISFRESFICPICGMNSRMRQTYTYTSKYARESSVYMYEYVTPSFNFYKERFPNIIGSEYVGEDCISGQEYDGILHEDALNLSFKDESFDLMISQDVFEHVSDYKLAFKEAYRCLKTGGELLFTVPFQQNEDKIITRAVIEKGEIKHLLPPEYHGNPMSEEGSLCFFYYGWDLLDYLRSIGFSDVYAIYDFDLEKAMFGNSPLFVAKK